MDGFPWWLSGKVSAYSDGVWVSSLGHEDPLEKGVTAHSSILAWEDPGQRNLVGYSPWGCKRMGYDLATKQQQNSVGHTGMSIMLELQNRVFRCSN